MSACTTCGACCASFRVDFSVFETQAEGGNVPDGLCVPVTDSTARLRGTDHSPPRCAALSGRPGTKRSAAFTNGAPTPAANSKKAATLARKPDAATVCPLCTPHNHERLHHLRRLLPQLPR